MHLCPLFRIDRSKRKQGHKCRYSPRARDLPTCSTVVSPSASKSCCTLQHSNGERTYHFFDCYRASLNFDKKRTNASVFQQDGGHATPGLWQQPPAPPEPEATEEARYYIAQCIFLSSRRSGPSAASRHEMLLISRPSSSRPADGGLFVFVTVTPFVTNINGSGLFPLFSAHGTAAAGLWWFFPYFFQ